MDLKYFQKEIDGFIDTYLESTSEKNRVSVEYILHDLRRQLLEILSENVQGEFNINKINDLCDVIGQKLTFFDPSILDSLSIPNLKNDILEARQRLKWQLINEELIRTVNTDQLFSPDDIDEQSPTLFRVIEAALKAESEDGTINWDTLAGKLPDEVKSSYRTEEIEYEERIRAVDEQVKIKAQQLGISDVVMGLASDPKKLAQFLELSGLQLSASERSQIIYVGFTGLAERHGKKFNELVRECNLELADLTITSDIPPSTLEDTVKLKISIPEGTTHLLINCLWARDINVEGQDTIEVDIPLKKGEENKISLMAYSYQEGNEDGSAPEKKIRSEVKSIYIQQLGEKPDTDTLIQFLESLKDETLEGLQEDEERKRLFIRFLEESSIKYFSGDFNEGRFYIKRLIDEQDNPFIINCFKLILKLFEKINRKKYPFIQEGQDLLFFQKYCVYKINEKRAEGQPGVILANEPGLGKTLTGLSIVHNAETLAICPNSAASTWIEQEAKFFKDPFILDLAGYAYNQRNKLLAERDAPATLTNIEFMRTGDLGQDRQMSKSVKKRFDLLNERVYPNKERIVLIDEAHFLKNESQQSEGIEFLDKDFLLLLTASPYRDPYALCKLMNKILPEDDRFKNPRAFSEAFPKNDPGALKALYLMVQPYVVRFLKSDVMRTYDSSIPLEDQPLSLPAKKHIDPFDESSGQGLFTLTSSQEEAILELFQDWNAWTEKYDHYLPKGKRAREDGIRSTGNVLTKTHALRQIVNNPAFIGSDEESPKHRAAKAILEKEIAEGGKVVIFCRYHNQVQAYVKMLEEMEIEHAEFTGAVSEIGPKRDASGKLIKYRVDEYNNYVFDDEGKLIVAKRGEKSKPILAIDYERLSFQNNPNIKVCITTYSAGSQSVTFTAANAMIKDDLPNDYIEEYQSDDRIHRVDDERRKGEARYYKLISQYSPSFLERMKELVIESNKSGNIQRFTAFNRWFRNGTYDEVHYHNLEAQKTGFELLNNGVVVDPELLENQQVFHFNGA